MKSESADLVYSKECPKYEFHLRVTTGDGKHVGEGVLKAHHLGADSIEAKEGHTQVERLEGGCGQGLYREYDRAGREPRKA